MAIKFNTLVLHGTDKFFPNHTYGFEDAGAEDYFKACGWAEATTDAPDYVFPAGSIEIDPGTIHNESGYLVSDLVKYGSVEGAKEAGALPAGDTTLQTQDAHVPADSSVQ